MADAERCAGSGLGSSLVLAWQAPGDDLENIRAQSHTEMGRSDFDVFDLLIDMVRYRPARQRFRRVSNRWR